MPSASGASVELQILFCAIALGIVQLLAALLASGVGRGLAWGIGPRDEGWPPLGKFGGRVERAFKNFLETFPLFAAAVLLAHALGKTTHSSVLGAQIYIWARVFYVPAYVTGVPFVRTLIWTASLAGIVMVLAAAWPAA